MRGVGVKLRRGWGWLLDWTLLGVRSQQTLELTLSYFKKCRKTQGKEGIGILGVLGFVEAGWLAPGYHWVLGRGPGAGNKVPSLMGK